MATIYTVRGRILIMPEAVPKHFNLAKSRRISITDGRDYVGIIEAQLPTDVKYENGILHEMEFRVISDGYLGMHTEFKLVDPETNNVGIVVFEKMLEIED